MPLRPRRTRPATRSLPAYRGHSARPRPSAIEGSSGPRSGQEEEQSSSRPVSNRCSNESRPGASQKVANMPVAHARQRSPTAVSVPKPRFEDSYASRRQFVSESATNVHRGNKRPETVAQASRRSPREPANARSEIAEGRMVDSGTVPRPRRPERRWGCSSAGRAPRSHRGGQGFESPHLHQIPQPVTFVP